MLLVAHYVGVFLGFFVVCVFLVFLPVCSPDFSKIEYKWVSMKRVLPDLMPKCGNL